MLSACKSVGLISTFTFFDIYYHVGALSFSHFSNNRLSNTRHVMTDEETSGIQQIFMTLHIYMRLYPYVVIDCSS